MVARQMRAVVVGASSILGKELAEELNNSPATAWDVQLLDETDDGQSQLSATGDEAVVIQPLTREAFEGADLVFFAGEQSVAREFWRSAAKAGASIVDLSGGLEGEAGFLVRCPWIQGGAKPDLTTAGVISAHPVALMLSLVEERLQGRFGLKSLAATVLEPASQQGSSGVDELHRQTVALLSFQSVPKDVFDAQVAFNLQDTLGEASRVRMESTREVIRRHVKHLIGTTPAAKLHVALVQAPVFHGYTISGFAELSAGASEEQVRVALNGGVVSADAENPPSNLAVTDSGDVLVSVHADSGEAFWLWIAADNLRLAARNAVACALELGALRPTARVQ